MTVHQLPVKPDAIEAFISGRKRTFRLPVTAENSLVTPGNFSGLDLETGRRRLNPAPELRVRCTFATAQARAVTVKPKVKLGDHFCARSGKQRITLEVIAIDVCRLQDITAEEVLWESTELKSLWAGNPWVWRYLVRVDNNKERL